MHNFECTPPVGRPGREIIKYMSAPIESQGRKEVPEG